MTVPSGEISAVRPVFVPRASRAFLDDRDNREFDFGADNSNEGLMTELRCYRAYFLSASDHIRSVAVIRTMDDASVSAEAEFLLMHSDYAAIEIWDGKRFVERRERAQQVA